MQQTKCSICKQLYPSEERTKFDGSLLCPSCLEAETVICADCGKRIRNRDNCGTISYPLCSECREREYDFCQNCGTLMHRGRAQFIGGEPYCSDCYDSHYHAVIHEYDYKPEPIFYGSGPRYFGIELEIDDAGESGEYAEQILSVANLPSERIYCKHDGSLDDGFEIVSHPMSPEYHLHSMCWEKVLAKADELGYSSHDAKTCGLHIHVSRAAFGESREEQEEAVGRAVYFVEQHWDKLLKFSRRTQHQLERWASRYGCKPHPKEMLAHVKNGHWSRYTCVNLDNRDTIEFRIFRGTLKFNTFVATLQLVNRICDVAFSLSDEELCALSWEDFIGQITEPELLAYLRERGLLPESEVRKDV